MSGQYTDRAKARRLELRQERIDEYLARRPAPLCACGCGENVRFNYESYPSTYLRGHNAIETKRRQMAEKGGTITADEFRQALRKVKANKGWTWDELARQGGVSPGRIRSLMFGQQKLVTRDWATDFLRRLAGLSAPPTPYQLKQWKLDAKAGREMEREDV